MHHAPCTMHHAPCTLHHATTLVQWAGSCWYYLRFADPTNNASPCGQEGNKWLPVDLYVGGQEHAVLHLLYARFWHKVLYDIGVVDHKEPFTQLVHQGMILGMDGEKMSKSRGNVINPDDIVNVHGADVLRLYEMFMGPLEATKVYIYIHITYGTRHPESRKHDAFRTRRWLTHTLSPTSPHLPLSLPHPLTPAITPFEFDRHPPALADCASEWNGTLPRQVLCGGHCGRGRYCTVRWHAPGSGHA
jgi:hypothetical protein